jgi:two-component system, LytTR family, sensor kinase
MFFLTLLFGIAITHFYRSLLIKLKILSLRLSRQLVYMIVFSFLKGLVFCLITLGLYKLFGLIKYEITVIDISSSILNFTVIFCLWNIIYFGFHYFQNYKLAEINSLRYLAASKESELNNLKAQLNPHFIFNCMNSIRALIDENPVNAKSAITQLSNILRTTLLMNKRKEISLKEEMELVQDYLKLEHIRYEERLHYEFNIEDQIGTCRIPPFIIQSQVENAIKHGISTLQGNGRINVHALKVGEYLKITVSNTGKLNSETPLTGVGFKNSIQRLELLYGSRGKISIKEEQDLVVVDITLPLKF